MTIELVPIPDPVLADPRGRGDAVDGFVVDHRLGCAGGARRFHAPGDGDRVSVMADFHGWQGKARLTTVAVAAIA